MQGVRAGGGAFGGGDIGGGCEEVRSTMGNVKIGCDICVECDDEDEGYPYDTVFRAMSSITAHVFVR